MTMLLLLMHYFLTIEPLHSFIMLRLLSAQMLSSLLKFKGVSLYYCGQPCLKISSNNCEHTKWVLVTIILVHDFFLETKW